jgi:hypothetical protein
MEDEQVSYNDEEEFKWFYLYIGNAGTETNGPREGKKKHRVRGDNKNLEKRSVELHRI